MKFRINYWTCSKFADWIRGEKKPRALTLDGWEDWKEEQKLKRPIRFYFSDNLLDKLQDFFYFPYDIYNEIKNYIDNRFVAKTHYLKTGLKPGKYYELDYRIIHALFNELVEFVEIEVAWKNNICEGKKYKFKKGRCVESGLDYLNWAGNLICDESCGYEKSDAEYGKSTKQAESAKKILEIYNWWKNIRPNRPDPIKISGWSDYCENKKDYTEQQVSELLAKVDEIENQQEDEDENMMIELINIRKSLWT